MAASRSMLESLLARVRQRATEPRAGAEAAIPSPPAKPVVAAATLSSSPVLETVAELEEEVEEYDEELIEILDDGDVASESGEVVADANADASPIELRPSASAAEQRRRAAPTTRPPGPRTSIAAAPPAAVAVASAPAAVALRADVVARRPVSAGAVVQSLAARSDARSASFLELLDASLKLGS